VQRLIQIGLLIALLGGLGGCFVPGYGYGGGYPVGGYAPYSYPWYYGRGYAPGFAVHHPWEEHVGDGHHTSFGHYAPAGGHAAGGGGHAGGGGRR
jgi:hypothetical protein